ncbi:MAG: hypothetical protein ABI217_10200 [Chthoniobacterales bacterium]
MKLRRILWVTVIAGTALWVAPAFAQEMQHKPMSEMMDEHHDMMMQMHQKMEAAWKEQDAELDKLIAQMKSASGDQRMPAMEAVISKLVELRKKEHADMVAMHEKMQTKMQEQMKENAATSPSP